MLVISPIWLLAKMLGMNWLFPELDRELPSEQRRMFRMCASGRTLEKQVIPARQADFRGTVRYTELAPGRFKDLWR